MRVSYGSRRLPPLAAAPSAAPVDGAPPATCCADDARRRTGPKPAPKPAKGSDGATAETAAETAAETEAPGAAVRRAAALCTDGTAANRAADGANCRRRSAIGHTAVPHTQTHTQTQASAVKTMSGMRGMPGTRCKGSAGLRVGVRRRGRESKHSHETNETRRKTHSQTHTAADTCPRTARICTETTPQHRQREGELTQNGGDFMPV